MNLSTSDIIDGESKLIETADVLFLKIYNVKVEAMVLSYKNLNILTLQDPNDDVLNCPQSSYETQTESNFFPPQFYHEH